MTTTSKPLLLPPKMCAQYVERAKHGDYQFYLLPDIYVWFNGNQKVVVVGEVGHVVQLTADRAAHEKLSFERAMQRQKERPSAKA